jgi:PRTRC genetic system ThiF family protein
MKHAFPKGLRTRPVYVHVIGCGGTGSQVLTALAQLDCAIRALGHPGLLVTAVDGDTVSHANVGRQMFYPSDVGHYKSEVLIHRINLALGTRWEARICKLQAGDSLATDIVIGCVDTRAARFAIMRSLERGAGMPYWLDFGNARDTGQVVLGQVSSDGRTRNPAGKLPHIGELFPEAIDPTLDGTDDTPSCSLAEALEKQALFINRAVTVHGMDLLWQLFRHGELTHHGAFINLKSGNVKPIPVDPAYWARFGYGPVKKHVRLKDFKKSPAANSGERQAA